MPGSIAEMIKGDYRCEEIVKCIMGLKTLDMETYRTLVMEGPMTAEKLGERLNKERSTAYRSLQNLISCGFVTRETKTIKDGGYYFEYSAVEPKRMKTKIRLYLDEWYQKMIQIVENLDKEIMQ